MVCHGPSGCNESGRLLLLATTRRTSGSAAPLVSWGRSRTVPAYSDRTTLASPRLSVTPTPDPNPNPNPNRWPTASTPTTTGAAGKWAAWRPSIPTRPRSPSVPTARCPPELEPEP